MKLNDLKGKDKSLKKEVRIMTEDPFRKGFGLVMNQMSKFKEYNNISMKEGIKKYGDKAVEAILKEYLQLTDSDSFIPRHGKDLTSSQKRRALNLIALVKKKRCGRVKVRACIDGRKQRRFIR